MKKISGILLAITLLLGVTACGATESTGASEADDAPAQEIDVTTDAGADVVTDEESDGPVDAEDVTVQSTEGNGTLSVQNGKLADASGAPIQLYGMSTHGIAWFPQFVTEETFKTLRDDWNTNCVRIAMYTEEYGGYCSGGNQEELKNLVRSGVNYATNLGMYVIIDWHTLSDNNPLTHKDEAISFFDEMSREFSSYGNVIYEICNEPNSGTSWSDVKTYGEEVIPVIRANAPNSVILIGTPTWCQEPNQAMADPLPYENVLYTVHFYADTHRDSLRETVKQCADNGFPIFVSEFGMCDASGSGSNNFDETTKWLTLLDEYDISYMCWNLANKDETSSVILSSSNKTSNWPEEELSSSGQWIRNWFIEK